MAFQKISDGRLVIAAYLFLILLVTLALSSQVGYEKALQHLNIPTMVPAFADLQVISGAYQTFTEGGDPYLVNPHDPWNRTLNYPRYWLALGFLGMERDNIVYIGTGIVLLFLFAVFKLLGPLNIREGIFAGLVIGSSSILLALERGNNDILIFLLMILAAGLYSKTKRHRVPITATIITIAAALKFYPLFSITLYMRENRKVFLLSSIAILFVTGLFVLFNIDDLMMISKNTPREVVRSYGTAVLPMAFLRNFPILSADLRPHFSQIGLTAGSLIFLVMAIIVTRKALLFRRENKVELIQSNFHISLFYIGSGIFLGSYILGNNWDYRLIFLILLLPQLFHWYRNFPILNNTVLTCILCIILATNWNFFSPELNIRITIFNEIVMWGLSAYILYLLVISLPDWKTARKYND